MTTIAYRNGVLAADSRATIGDIISPERAKKIYAFADGSAAAFCGKYTAGMALAEWLTEICAGRQAGPLPDYDGCTLMHVTPQGVMIYENAGAPFRLESDFIAFGSGMEGALACLHLGHSAVEAVWASCHVDIYSGLPVQSVTMPDLVKKPKPARKKLASK